MQYYRFYFFNEVVIFNSEIYLQHAPIFRSSHLILSVSDLLNLVFLSTTAH